MSHTDGFAPGHFCWAELATTDPAGAKAFYTSLFDWRADDRPMGEGMVYTLLQKAGRDAGALYRQGPEQQGVPPNWQLYVATESADASAARARELGGRVILEPMDVNTLGRFAVLQDPKGAVIAVWEAKQQKGLGVVDEPGAFCWGELMTNDVARSAAFYKQLFGWGSKDDPRYTEWTLGGRSIGGMIEIEKDWGPVPPHWMAYFQVEACDASVAKATSLGAAVVMPARDFPGVGRIAMLKDPQGAAFYVIQLTGPLGH